VKDKGIELNNKCLIIKNIYDTISIYHKNFFLKNIIVLNKTWENNYHNLFV